jgi:Zinc-binding dehydrogenase
MPGEPDVGVQGDAANEPRSLRGLWRRFATRVRAAAQEVQRQSRITGKHLLGAYIVAAIAGLIVLRAVVGALDFISVGWMLVLVALPLLPWLLPRTGVFLKEISPYVQAISLGGLKHTAQPNGVDALIDMVTFDPDTFAPLAKAVRPGGKVATLTGGATEDALAAAGLTGQMAMAGTSRDSLSRLVAGVEDGTLTIDVERALPLDDADKGLETMANRRARGKIVITINN